MGVYEERNTNMHWQQNERYLSSGYEGNQEPSPAPRASSPSSPRDCNSCSEREPCDTAAPTTHEPCAGCGVRITDRYYLLALEKRWHIPCLICCQCKMPLDSEQRCYAKDAYIFCRNDYFRLFGSKRCARCQATISSSELVMKARDLVFHVNCFSCALCNTPLKKGDEFGIRDSVVYCRLHYDTTVSKYENDVSMSSDQQTCIGGYAGQPSANYPYPDPDFVRIDQSVGKGIFYSDMISAPTPRQKGRPRKKKPKDQDIVASNLDVNPDYLEMGFRGVTSLGGSARTKRMRTSFKHHQLRTMKSYFAINHNPDAKDLKQLSQKTGLPKRVLQVWFQNARAKWRRMLTKQGNKLSDKCSPDDSLELDIYRGPMGSIQSLPPHSPTYSVMGGPPSPNSLDGP